MERSIQTISANHFYRLVFVDGGNHGDYITSARVIHHVTLKSRAKLSDFDQKQQLRMLIDIVNLHYYLKRRHRHVC